MRAAQIPGGAGTGATNPDGAAPHLLIQFVHHAHELFAALALSVALLGAQQCELLATAFTDLQRRYLQSAW